jgi:hypothetical protein
MASEIQSRAKGSSRRACRRGPPSWASKRIEVALNLLVGAFYARYLAGPRAPAGFAWEVVEVVWKGLGLAVKPATARARRK